MTSETAILTWAGSLREDIGMSAMDCVIVVPMAPTVLLLFRFLMVLQSMKRASIMTMVARMAMAMMTP